MATNTLAQTTELGLQRMRFRQFLKWTLITFLGATILYAAVFLVSQALLAGLIALICLAGFGIGLAAWRQLAQGQLTSAVITNTIGLVGGALLVALAAPALYPADALVPLLGVAASLPYIHGRIMRQMLLACWIMTVVIVTLGLYVDLLQLPPPPFEPLLLISGFGAAGGLICLLLWQFSERLNDMLTNLRATNESLENTNTALADANGQLNEQLEQQRQLLNLVTTLETPAVPLAEGVLFVPIVGHVDTRRALDLNERLLTAASDQRARLVILDIAGVSVIDTEVAQALLQTAQALRLLGCRVTLSGISPENALTLTRLEVELHGVSTVRSPQEALASWTSGAGYIYDGD